MGSQLNTARRTRSGKGPFIIYSLGGVWYETSFIISDPRLSNFLYTPSPATLLLNAPIISSIVFCWFVYYSPWARPNFLTSLREKLWVVSLWRMYGGIEKNYDSHPHCVTSGSIFVAKSLKNYPPTWKRGSNKLRPKEGKQKEYVVINIFVVFNLKTCVLARFYKNKMICVICHALWVTNIGSVNVRYSNSLVFSPDSSGFFLHVLLAKGLDKHSLHTIIPRRFWRDFVSRDGANTASDSDSASKSFIVIGVRRPRDWPRPIWFAAIRRN